MNSKIIAVTMTFLIPGLSGAAPANTVVTDQDLQKIIALLPVGTYDGRSSGENPPHACSGVVAFDGTTISIDVSPAAGATGTLSNHFTIFSGKKMRCDFMADNVAICKTFPLIGLSDLKEQLVINLDKRKHTYVVSYSATKGKERILAQCTALQPK